MAAGAAQEWSYRGVRFVHLALSAALIPAGLAYFYQHRSDLSLLTLAAAWAVAIAIMLFGLPMDQNRYPIGLVSALFRTGPMVAGVGFAAASRTDLLAGAFFGATSLVAGLALTITLGSLIELFRQQADRSAAHQEDRRRLAERVLLPLAALAWAGVGCTFPMLLVELQSKSDPPANLMLALWGFQALSTTQFWFGQSTWARNERDARTDLFESSWSGFTAAFFTAGFLAVTVVALWFGLAR